MWGKRIRPGKLKSCYEVTPHLESTFVTDVEIHNFEERLSLGRRLAANKIYSCHALKLGNIYIHKLNTDNVFLLHTHSECLNDIAFFSKDVHLLASVGIDGRIMVSEISDAPNEPQITAKIVIALKISGEDKINNPRVCWHYYNQVILVVGVGKSILRIDTSKVMNADIPMAENPLECSVDNLVFGIQLIGNHEDEVTDLSMCRWTTTSLVVTASVDGEVKIWNDHGHEASLLFAFSPYGRESVFAATFLTAPSKPDHIVLVTAGSQNLEVKFWVSISEDGKLFPCDDYTLRCTQTLELQDSSMTCFVNQVVAFSENGLLLFANAMRGDVICAIHIDYGPNPAATRMDYISEFPVFPSFYSSFTGFSDILDGQSVAQIYFVGVTVIFQITLYLSQYCPPALEEATVEEIMSKQMKKDSEAKSVALWTELEKQINSNLKALVKSQIQTQCQASSEVLMGALKSCIDTSVIPVFEKCCKAMFEQVDHTFEKGVVEYMSAAQQQSEITLSLRDAFIKTASFAVTQLSDGHEKGEDHVNDRGSVLRDDMREGRGRGRGQYHHHNRHENLGGIPPANNGGVGKQAGVGKQYPGPCRARVPDEKETGFTMGRGGRQHVLNEPRG